MRLEAHVSCPAGDECGSLEEEWPPGPHPGSYFQQVLAALSRLRPFTVVHDLHQISGSLARIMPRDPYVDLLPIKNSPAE